MKHHPIEKEEELTDTKTKALVEISAYADDSSDEEDIERKAKSYDTETSLNAYKSKSKFPYEDDSFITHSLGIEMLYSTQVNHSYYPKKATLLGNNALPSLAKITEWIENTVTGSIKNIFSLSSQSAVTQKLFEEFLEKYGPIIQATKEHLFKEQRSLFRQEHNNTILPLLENALMPLKEILVDFITKIPEQAELDIGANTLTARKLADNSSIEKLIYNSAKIKEWLAKEGLLDPSDPEKPLTSNQKRYPNLRQKAEEIKQRNLSFGEATLIKIFSENSEFVVENRIFKNKTRLARAYAVDIIHAELARGENSLVKEIKQSENPVLAEYVLKSMLLPEESPLTNLVKARPDFFAKFVLYTTEALKTELLLQIEAFSKHFLSSLSQQRKQLPIIFERTILPEQHHFSSKNAIGFLVNLRLSNRSQKRNIRQKEEDGITKFDGEIVSRSWKFAGSPFSALETQEITTTKARTDLVNNLGSYSNIYSSIQEVKSLINSEIEKKNSPSIQDADIARWLRQLLNGETTELFTYHNKIPLPVEPKHLKVLSKFCVNLTFLLFGTETVRNPASLITQQMMLDLILSGDLTWKQALADDAKLQQFGGGDMPMSMSSHKEKEIKKKKNGEVKKKKNGEVKEVIKTVKAEPVASARSLHKEYAAEMLYPYQYPGDKQSKLEKIKALSQREALITQKWTETFAQEASTLAQKIQALKEKSKNEWYKNL